MQKYMLQRTIIVVPTVWIAYFKLNRSIVLNKEAKVQNQTTGCLANFPVERIIRSSWYSRMQMSEN